MGIFLHIYIFKLLLFLKKVYTFLKWPWPSNPLIMSSNVIFSRVLLVHWAHLFLYHLKCLLCDEHFVILIETFRYTGNTKHTDIRQAVVCIFIYIYRKNGSSIFVTYCMATTALYEYSRYNKIILIVYIPI